MRAWPDVLFVRSGYDWRMNRRCMIGLLGSAAVWPLAASGQDIPVIGYLTTRTSRADAPFTAAFRRGLKERGFAEGENVKVEYRFADGAYDRLPGLIADLVRHRVALLVAGGAPTVPATAKSTSLPVVFVTGGDPVQAGLVASLNRPGGHLTGINVLNTELTPKKLEVLEQVVPSARTIAVLVNPNNPNTASQVELLRTALRAKSVKLQVLHASKDDELETAFAAAKLSAGGLVIGSDAFFNGRGKTLAALAVQHSLPAVFTTREFAAAGGLMSYGANIQEAFRLAGHYAARILKGANPADLPVQQSSKVEFVINLKTAKSLDLNVPMPLLGRADEVIE